MKLTAKHAERFVKVEHKIPGNVVGYQRDRVRLPNQVSGTREFMLHPGAVGVLAFPKPGYLLLVKQYRYPVREFTYEIPAGKLGKGENPLSCVKRELEEETGYRAGRVQKTVHFWPTAAFSDEVIHLYVADRLIKTIPNPDEDEFLEVKIVSLSQIETMIRTGQIHDSKTLIAYSLWRAGIMRSKP